MSDFEQLRRVVEDNFVLQSLETKELRNTFVGHMSIVREAFDGQMKALAHDVDENLRKQASRTDKAVEAIRALGEGSVDVRKELSELKERVKRLEDKAS